MRNLLQCGGAFNQKYVAPAPRRGEVAAHKGEEAAHKGMESAPRWWVAAHNRDETARS